MRTARLERNSRARGTRDNKSATVAVVAAAAAAAIGATDLRRLTAMYLFLSLSQRRCMSPSRGQPPSVTGTYAIETTRVGARTRSENIHTARWFRSNCHCAARAARARASPSPSRIGVAIPRPVSASVTGCSADLRGRLVRSSATHVGISIIAKVPMKRRRIDAALRISIDPSSAR